MTLASKLVCIHGHFYQPPRENPWLEAVEVEDSAAPFHDWNARVNSECYAANAVARALDEQDRITDLVNTYESISFDFGPTLLTWLQDSDPQTYEAVLEADRRSLKAHGGHGNAMAQAYNHVILPLANERDQETQVRWGIADFVHRFGREPEGMWLPETAVDSATLEVLARQGIKLAVLAPHQAEATRPLDKGAGEADGEVEWLEVDEAGIDTTRPYLCRLESGKTITLFFYDGAVSRAVAFEGLLSDGGAFTERLLDRFEGATDEPQLVHIATDGESYGHHHRYGDMALAFTLRALPTQDGVRLTNYGECLELMPPTAEVRIAERTSWSCAHGVGRWSKDCGCRIAPQSSQAWREPLRDALNWLRDEIDGLFVTKAGLLLDDPWQARNEYIEVVLDRTQERCEAFLERQGGNMDHFDRSDALSLLEMERHRMLMFTSCGWFFDDCAGIETVQNLKYAARAIQLAAGFGATGLEQKFVDRLRGIESNDAAAGDGAAIYDKLVRPSVVDLRRVVAHHAITNLFEPDRQAEKQLYCYQLENLDWNHDSYGGTQLAVGRVRVRSLITMAGEDVSFGLLHFGGHDFNCSLRGAVTVEGYASMRDELLRTYETESLTEMVHAFGRFFEDRHFGLPELFVEGRRAVLATLTRGVVADMQRIYDHFFEEHRRLFDFLKDARHPLPDVFTRTIEFALERRIVAELARLESEAKTPGDCLNRLEDLAQDVERGGVALDQRTVGPALTSGVEAVAEQLVPDWSKASLAALRRTLALADRLKVELQLWNVQNAVLNALLQRPPEGNGGEPSKELTSILTELGLAPSLLSSAPGRS